MKKSFILFNAILILFINVIISYAKYDIREIERNVSIQFKRLKSSNVSVRFLAIKRLSRIPHKKALKPLIYALNDSSKLIRKKVCRAIANLDYQEAVEPLIRRLSIEKELFVQKEIILTLGKLKDQRAVWIIQTYLKHSNLIIKVTAKKALKMLDS